MSDSISDRILWHDGEFRISQCAVCRHKTPGEWTCEAFGKQIPAEILANSVSHEQPFEGDEGVRLEPIEVPRAVFENMTRLNWPAGSVSYSDAEDLLDRASAGEDVQVVLVQTLWGLDMLTLGSPDKTSENEFGLHPIELSDGRSVLPFFTSLSKLNEFTSGSKVKERGGPEGPRIRCRFDNFDESLWDEFSAVINPGDPSEIVIDPRAARQSGPKLKRTDHLGSATPTIPKSNEPPADASDAPSDDPNNQLMKTIKNYWRSQSSIKK